VNVVLYQPQIPPNTGNIARLCVATDSTLHLIRPLGFDTDDATLRRAGLDYWEHLKIFYYDGWKEFLRSHPNAGMHFYSKKVTQPYTVPRYEKDDFLVFGSETQGLPDAMLEKYACRTWTIPMWGPTRSINLATSVGIVLYEALRQIHLGFLLNGRAG
jgi:tRNA (cytidine/uridine-2'-O-)-methyltransferase